jgi:hypothetical protein
MGIGMTERQGGSDLRANTTCAEQDGRSDWGEHHRIIGHNSIRVPRLKDKPGNRSNALSEVEIEAAEGYHEAPLNSIWESAGNEMDLNVLRALGCAPAVREALAAEHRLAVSPNASRCRCRLRCYCDMPPAKWPRPSVPRARPATGGSVCAPHLSFRAQPSCSTEYWSCKSSCILSEAGVNGFSITP